MRRRLLSPPRSSAAVDEWELTFPGYWKVRRRIIRDSIPSFARRTEARRYSKIISESDFHRRVASRQVCEKCPPLRLMRGPTFRTEGSLALGEFQFNFSAIYVRREGRGEEGGTKMFLQFKI